MPANSYCYLWWMWQFDLFWVTLKRLWLCSVLCSGDLFSCNLVHKCLDPALSPSLLQLKDDIRGMKYRVTLNSMLQSLWFALAWLIGKGEQIGAWYIFWFSGEKYIVPWWWHVNKNLAAPSFVSLDSVMNLSNSEHDRWSSIHERN
jgi:hypothetical protein